MTHGLNLNVFIHYLISVTILAMRAALSAWMENFSRPPEWEKTAVR